MNKRRCNYEKTTHTLDVCHEKKLEKFNKEYNTLTKLQKELVHIVSNALEFAKKRVKPGVSWTDLCESVHLKMYQGCFKIGLVKEFFTTTDQIN